MVCAAVVFVVDWKTLDTYMYVKVRSHSWIDRIKDWVCTGTERSAVKDSPFCIYLPVLCEVTHVRLRHYSIEIPCGYCSDVNYEAIPYRRNIVTVFLWPTAWRLNRPTGVEHLRFPPNLISFLTRPTNWYPSTFDEFRKKNIITVKPQVIPKWRLFVIQRQSSQFFVFSIAAILVELTFRHCQNTKEVPCNFPGFFSRKKRTFGSSTRDGSTENFKIMFFGYLKEAKR